MAAKKKAAAPKKAAPKAGAAQKTPRIAMKLLNTLPPIDARRRKLYLAAFTHEQCASWGDRTKANSVFAESERFAGFLGDTLKKPVTGYSLHRLAWLCQLITELDDAIDGDAAANKTEQRTERGGVFALADRARRRLASGLMAAATGNALFLKEITDRNETTQVAHTLESSLTGLLQLALRLRRSDDGELLADDVGLTQDFLSSVSAMTDQLRLANERTFGGDGGNDSMATNLVEGRVLREMAFALRTLRRAKEDGEVLKLPTPGANLTSVTRRAASDTAEPATPPKPD